MGFGYDQPGIAKKPKAKGPRTKKQLRKRQEEMLLKVQLEKQARRKMQNVDLLTSKEQDNRRKAGGK